MRAVVLLCSIGFLVLLVNSGGWLADQLDFRTDESFLKNSLSILIEREIADKEIPGIAISVVDDQNILFEDGFGFADAKKTTPVTPYTVFQAGGVAQLFTTIAIMQRVEHNKLHLDSTVVSYLPNFNPQNPYGLALTLRQVLSHQSGLVTEPPLGHYLDPQPARLADIVNSINHTSIVFPPEMFTKYSNAGYAVAGHVLEKSVDKPFEQHMRAVLDRMHLKRTSFRPRLDLKSKLAEGHISTFDNRIVPIPNFEISNDPAQNLYSTINDLGAFLRVLFADGLSPNGVILTAESFEQMWTVQLSTARKELPYGLGFAISFFEGERRATLTSSTHGNTIRIDLLPDQDIGVVAVANLEDADAVLKKVTEYALRNVLAQHQESGTPSFPTGEPADSQMVQLARGYYVNQNPLYISQLDDELFLYQEMNRHRVRQFGDSLLVDDRNQYGAPLITNGSNLQFKDDSYSRRNATLPPFPSARLLDYTGMYGPPHNPFYVAERKRKLFVLDGWNRSYELTAAAQDTFNFPVDGLYGGESLIFLRNEEQLVDSVLFASMPLARISDHIYSTELTRIPVKKPLPARAARNSPPAELTAKAGSKRSELIDLTLVDPLFNMDIRYASVNNLFGKPVYGEARALMQRPVAEAVFRIQRRLRQRGLEFMVFDTYQPWHVTSMIWESTPDSLQHMFSDPSTSLCHNNGTMVSLTLYELENGEPLPMPTDYGVVSAHTYADSPLPAETLRWNRDYLRRLMEGEGFTVDAEKWWQFTHKSCPQYPLLNAPVASVPIESPDNVQRIFTVNRD